MGRDEKEKRFREYGEITCSKCINYTNQKLTKWKGDLLFKIVPFVTDKTSNYTYRVRRSYHERLLSLTQL